MGIVVFGLLCNAFVPGASGADISVLGKAAPTSEATEESAETVTAEPTPMPSDNVIIDDEVTVDEEEVGLGTPDVDTLPKTGDDSSIRSTWLASSL